MKNPIADIIRTYIEEPGVVFVFPSEIAARMWQEKSLDFLDEGVLPDERFIAWDQFKRECAERTRPGYKEIRDCIRDFYAENLMARNAAQAERTGEPLLHALVPSRFAAQSAAFSAWISGILPSLEMWSEKAKRPATAESGQADGDGRQSAADAEEADLAFIKEDYRAFLDKHTILESAWSRRFAAEAGTKHLILFFEAIEDFADYSSALSPALYAPEASALPAAANLPPVSAVSVPPFLPQEHSLCAHETFREEFTHIALQIESLLMRGERTDSIAVSLNNIEANAPYFMREMYIRGIPAVLRAGHVLGQGGAGKIFSLLKQCAAENFSFQSVKNLLYRETLAWNSPDLPVKLIQFGIDNHCVSSWEEDGNLSDIWESAFKLARATTDARLSDWYKKLKRSILALTSCETFSAIRAAWFVFRNDFLNTEAISEEDNREIARCIEELEELIALEKEYADCLPPDPFSFFVNRLNKKIYVPRQTLGGVSVFPYRVAAGTPFKFHFVAGISQEDSTVLYQQLQFLRRDKRKQLFALETDASEAFFSLYACGTEKGGVRFSSANRAVDTYKTPHNVFYGAEASAHSGATQADLPDDPFAAEEQGRTPARIYPVQKSGFEFQSAQAKAHRDSLFKTGLQNFCSTNAMEEIRARLNQKQRNRGGNVRVTATDLKPFSECPAQWFFQKILGLEKKSFAAELLNERQLGLVYHNALKSLYDFILEKDGAFLSANIEQYKEKAAELAEAHTQDAIEFKGPLTAPILSTLAARITEGMHAVLREDAKNLNGAVPAVREGKFSFSENGMDFFGIIDRISIDSATSTAVIIDYKSGVKYPKKSDYEPDTNGEIKDFQIPLYALLAEKTQDSPTAGHPITQAWIYSIKDEKYSPVLNFKEDDAFGDIFDGRTKRFLQKEEFEPVMEILQKVSEDFRDAIETCDFSKEKIKWETCEKCAYKEICRKMYAVTPKISRSEAQTADAQ